MKKDIVIKEIENVKEPSPIKDRICKCGCKQEFSPKRRDQLYLNRQHANFGYNHGHRKKRAKNESNIQKILRKNNRILEKYHKASGEIEATCSLTILIADGFNTTYYVAQTQQEGNSWNFTYDYAYQLYSRNNYKLLKIQKR
jgi:hypothetical protein